MNRTLMRAIAECAVFFGLSSDEAVQPDVAVAQLEQLAAILKALPSQDRGAFRAFLADMSEEEARNGAAERAAFLASAFENLGLEE